MIHIPLKFYTDDGRWTPVPETDPGALQWRAVSPVEDPAGSVGVSATYVRFGAVGWDGRGSGFRIVALGARGPLGEWNPRDTANAGPDWWKIPNGARIVTAEGRRENPGVIVAVALLQIGK